MRAGIALATGEYLIIQDADLEYDPNDYVPMLQALLAGRGDVVYGSRYMGRGRHANQSLAAYLGGRSLSLAALVFAGAYLTDTVTALKLFRTADMQIDRLWKPAASSSITRSRRACSRAAGASSRSRFIYAPRSREEGKKIGARDWFIGVRTFFRYRNG